MADWKATERVLDRVKYVATLGNGASIDEEQASKDEKAIEAVFKFVLLGADRKEYKKNWSFVGAHLKGRRKEQQALRARVRGRLEPRFESDAFVVTVTFENSEDVNAALNKFRREDLLAWGAELLAADAANVNPDTAAEPVEAPPSISSTGSTSLRRSVRKGCARLTGRSGFFSGKERLTAGAVASLNSDTPSFVASNANHSRTATSKSRSDRSFWGRISYHSSQLSELLARQEGVLKRLARSVRSREKDYVPPRRVLGDELDEISDALRRGDYELADNLTEKYQDAILARESGIMERNKFVGTTHIMNTSIELSMELSSKIQDQNLAVGKENDSAMRALWDAADKWDLRRGDSQGDWRAANEPRVIGVARRPGERFYETSLSRRSGPSIY